MKRGFTLIEMLVVVVVLVTLMTMTFRLSSIGSESEARIKTVTRLQKIENCLSGYQAAFGSYPPVALHGSHDIFARVGTHGIQTDERNENLWNWTNIGDASERQAWAQVEAACRAQPVDCRYPFPEHYSTLIKSISDEMKERANSGDDYYKKYWQDEWTQQKLTAGFDDGVTDNIGRHAANSGKADWRKTQLFKFGLMSYLLPRYLIMMNGDQSFFTSYAQWKNNNTEPSDPFDGSPLSWEEVKEYAEGTTSGSLAHLANIPSQAVCARWMPNLENACRCNHTYTLFGIDIRDASEGSDLNVDNPDIEVFSPGEESSGSTSQQYILDGITILDGWGRTFYYYSKPPYQAYTVWSAGSNGRTFPPWISRDKLPNDSAKKCVAKWTADDIIHMSN